jgi:5-methylcytosine-specific restriction endonuclease McrA
MPKNDSPTVPIAMGGANTERNIQLLCEVCNRREAKSLG